MSRGYRKYCGVSSHCVCCGKLLTDIESINRGIGPECLGKGYEIPEFKKETIYELTRMAAKASEAGDIESVMTIIRTIHSEHDLPILAEKMLRRFRNAKKNAKIKIIDVGNGKLRISTPFKRSQKSDFLAAWRAIQGVQFSFGRRSWSVPIESRPAVWSLLQKFFPGAYGEGPKGLFRVPVPETLPK